MENKFLGRSEAPIAEGTWALLDNTMVMVAKSQLAGRKLIGIEGPFGFGTKGIPLADFEMGKGVMGSGFLPLTELKVPFSMTRRDLASVEGGNPYLDTNPLVTATLNVSALEDQVVFDGMSGCTGLLNAEGTNSQTLSKWDKVGTAADQIISAVTKLDEAGFHGPYTMALAPQLVQPPAQAVPAGRRHRARPYPRYCYRRSCQGTGPQKGRSTDGLRRLVCSDRDRAGHVHRVHRSIRRRP